MLCEALERKAVKIPVLGRLYWKNAASLKRAFCLCLHHFGMLKPFTFVLWLATNRCNFSCPFCELSSGEARPGELSREEAHKLIGDLSAMGVKRLVVSGGEPLMRQDICEIMAYANSRNLQLGLVTNGWHVPALERTLRTLHFFLYFTSIDGAPEYHDRVRGAKKAFVRALQGLELFAEMRVPARIVNTVVHPENIRQLEGMVEIIRNSAATSWRLTPVCNVGRAEGATGYDLSKAQLSRLVDFIKEHRNAVNVDFGESHTYLWRLAGAAGVKPFFCGAGLTRCSITSEGEVIGCQWISTSFSEGNLRDRSFPQIWKDGFTRFRKNEFQRGCFDCVHFDGCRGGCWAEMKKRGACLKSAWNEGE
jgi:radical SAM protein with 4Fe4S-binding SPASM domain